MPWILWVEKRCLFRISTNCRLFPKIFANGRNFRPTVSQLTKWDTKKQHCFQKRLALGTTTLRVENETTSPKTNMETQNHDLEKVTPFKYDHFWYLPRTPNDLYFWRSTPKNKSFSTQNKGHLGSRYVKFLGCQLMSFVSRNVFLFEVPMSQDSHENSSKKLPMKIHWSYHQQSIYVYIQFFRGLPFLLNSTCLRLNLTSIAIVSV